MKGICEFSVDQWRELLEGEPAYRAKQIVEWIYRRGVLEVDGMTNLPKHVRSRLDVGPSLQLERVAESSDDETTKFLWRLHDDRLVESVLIRSGDRRTVCVSSQVGCPARCAFCASGKEGLFRNLSVGEIVEQVVQIGAREPVTHVVFMGMGEPLANLEGVLPAIKHLIDPQMVGLSKRRVTVSTVGVLEGIEAMIASNLGVSLVLSLHAPNQKLRRRLIPFARKVEIEPLLAVMEQYQETTGRDVTYEYILIKGVNDQPEHAHELVSLLRGRQCTINLIPYNPVVGLRLQRPERGAIEAFRAILRRGRIVNTCRYTKGDDIAAACGQLALQEVA